MSKEERNKAVVQQMYTELFSQGKLSLAEKLIAADFLDQGMFMGIAPTGRAVHQKQMHFMHFRNDQMVEHLAVRDDLGLRQQLGTIAAPAEKL